MLQDTVNTNQDSFNERHKALLEKILNDGQLNKEQKHKLAIVILNDLNIDLSQTIKDCEFVSSTLLMEYQESVIKVLKLLS